MTDTNTGQMLADLNSTNDAVRGNGWVAPGLGGASGPLGLLGSSFDPLTGLASAGFGWFMPFVSFLSDGLKQLQGGNEASVTSGSQDFGNAGQNIASLAGSYGNSTTAQTSKWSGSAASDYRDAGAQHATGVAGLGAASTTVGSSISGAGQVVAQAIAQITDLIAQAVGQIVPILTQAVARAQQTNGESIAEAIPPCVAIAVEYAVRIAAKLADLLASGQNLMKLVQGALGIVDLIQQALSGISKQSTQAGAPATPSAGSDQPQSSGPTDSGMNSGNAQGAADSGSGSTGDAGPGAGSSASMPTADGLDGGGSTSSGVGGVGGSTMPGAGPFGVAPQSAAVVQPLDGTMPDSSPYPVHADGGQASTGAVPVGTAGIGFAPGTRAGAGGGADTVRQPRGVSSSPASTVGRGTSDGVPLGRLGGARAARDTDKEHKRKYGVVENHEEVLRVAPRVISSRTGED